MKLFGRLDRIWTCIVIIHILKPYSTDAKHFTAIDIQMKHAPITSVINKMFSCSLTKTLSLRERLRNTLDCLSPHIIHCKATNKAFMTSYAAHYSSFSFCGNIITQPIYSIHTTVSLRVLDSHILQFDFLLFAFFRTSATCGPDKLHLVDHAINKTHAYCGSRRPWKIISTGSHCDIMMKVLGGSSSRMTLFYHAIYKPHITGVMVVYDQLLLTESLENTFTQQIQIHSFTLSVLPYQVIHLSVVWQKVYGLDYVRVYDGPGEKSPIIMFLNKTSHSGSYQTKTSAFSMYLLITPTTQILSLSMFSVKTLKSKQRCKTGHTFEGEYAAMLESFSLKSNSKNDNFVCRFQSTKRSFQPHPSIYVEDLVFSGANTLDSLYTQGCNYGGIFIRVLYTNSSFIDIALCANLKHFSWYPDQTSSIELFAIWYSGYSEGRVIGYIHYGYCPAVHLSSNSILSQFDEVSSCQFYICYKTSCNVRLGYKEKSFGPSSLKITVPYKLQLMPTKSETIEKVPVDCKSEVDTWAFDKIQLIYNKSTHRRHLFQFYTDSFIENYIFLHNLTVSIDTCLQFPVGMLLVIHKCGTSQPFTDLYRPGFLINVYSPCSDMEFERSKFYHTNPVSVEIVLFINIKMMLCDPLCRNKTIIIHEVIPDEGIVYRYNFSFTGQFKWLTHHNQGGFSFTVHPRNTNCRVKCAINIATELTDDTPDTNKYHYKAFPMR